MEAGVSQVCFPAVVQTAFGAERLVASRRRGRRPLIYRCANGGVYGVLTAMTLVLPSTQKKELRQSDLRPYCGP